MKDCYIKSSWGWNLAEKRAELLEDSAWYLLAVRADTGAPAAFAHFR